MTIIQALKNVPPDKWQVQSLANCFLRGDVKKKSASITFETTPEIVLALNHAAIVGGKASKVGMIIWVDAEAWELATET